MNITVEEKYPELQLFALEVDRRIIPLVHHPTLDFIRKVIETSYSISEIEKLKIDFSEIPEDLELMIRLRLGE